MSRIVRVDAERSRYIQKVSVGPHVFQADEPIDSGGNDAGPNPYEFLLTALGTCASITVQMYAERKQWSLEGVRVELSYAKVPAEDSEAGDGEVRMVDQIEMEISFDGNLSDEQQRRLIEIANKCPVHRTLTSQIRIRSHRAAGDSR